ncbi:MAG: hypothetical protein D6680_14005 [Cyanobacteria bacterium J007]|nr:MAG: hypothetical protein D6680_14005 [Cyanobacteria bacterium J007]
MAREEGLLKLLGLKKCHCGLAVNVCLELEQLRSRFVKKLLPIVAKPEGVSAIAALFFSVAGAIVV